MPLNNRRITQIILGEVDGVVEKCDGYRNLLRDAITDIIDYELGHMVAATNIQQKVTGRCTAAGESLAKQITRSVDES